MHLLRHGATGGVRRGPPPTLGTFLRGFTFGHVRQLDKAVSRAIGEIPEDEWAPIKYRYAIYDEDEQRCVSDAQVAGTGPACCCQSIRSAATTPRITTSMARLAVTARIRSGAASPI